MSTLSSFQPPPRVRKVVIPIAGYGTRMYPASRAVCKALMPIVDVDGVVKPILQCIIEQALSALDPNSIYNDVQFCIVVQPGQRELIEAYFSEETIDAIRKKPECAVHAQQIAKIGRMLTFALQEKQEGFGHSILCAREFVGPNDPFLVLLGDHVYLSTLPNGMSCISQVVNMYQLTGKPVTGLTTCTEQELSANGVVQGTIWGNHSPPVYHLTSTVEKPSVEVARSQLIVPDVASGTYLCYLGIDLLNASVFDILQSNYDNNVRTKGELQLRDAMGAMMRVDDFYGVRVSGNRFDTGQPNLYAATITAFHQAANALQHKPHAPTPQELSLSPLIDHEHAKHAHGHGHGGNDGADHSHGHEHGHGHSPNNSSTSHHSHSTSTAVALASPVASPVRSHGHSHGSGGSGGYDPKVHGHGYNKFNHNHHHEAHSGVSADSWLQNLLPRDKGRGSMVNHPRWYDLHITDVYPHYPKMLNEVVQVMFPVSHGDKVLDLCGGNGQLSVAIASAYPEAEYELLDGNITKFPLVRERFNKAGLTLPKLTQYNIELIGDANTPVTRTFPNGPYHLIVSSLAIHCIVIHCPGVNTSNTEQVKEKTIQLFRIIYDSLVPGGHVLTADHINVLPLAVVTECARAAGFIDVECAWREKELFVLGARKPTDPTNDDHNQQQHGHGHSHGHGHGHSSSSSISVNDVMPELIPSSSSSQLHQHHHH